MLFPLEVTPAEIPDIPGLKYVPAFIGEAEEAAFVQKIDAAPWDATWERRRQSYGAAYGSHSAGRPIPSWATLLIDRFAQLGLSDRPFDQMLVNEYQPGQGIALHRDYSPFERTVLSLSLLSPCVMDFRQPDDDRRASLLLGRRSLLILSDEARYDWQHGIARRKKDRWHEMSIVRGRRISITFRLLRRS